MVKRLNLLGWVITIAVGVSFIAGTWLSVRQNILIQEILIVRPDNLDDFAIGQMQRQLLLFQTQLKPVIITGKVEDPENLDLHWDLVMSKLDVLVRGVNADALENNPFLVPTFKTLLDAVKESDRLYPRLKENPARIAPQLDEKINLAVDASQELYGEAYNTVLRWHINLNKSLRRVQLDGLVIDGMFIFLVAMLMLIIWRSMKYKLNEAYQLNEELKQSEERFRNLVEGSIQGVKIHRGGAPLFANQTFADIFGYSSPEAIMAMASTEKLSHPDDQARLRTYYLARMRGEPVPDRYEYKGIRKDGKVIWLECYARKVYWEGEFAVQTTVYDITERKAAESALVVAKETAIRATRIKDKFVSLVAHDLRAPISSQMLMLDVLKSMQGSSSQTEEVKEFCRAIETKNQSMLEMIDDLLKISRLQSGEIRPEKKIVESSMLSAVLYDMKPLSDKKGIQLVDEIPENFRLHADPNLFREVLANLISNAIKFCNPQGRVTLGVADNDAPTIMVWNTGAGVDERLGVDLFKHEVKTTSQGTAGELGTGLGLPLCHDIIQAHGGRMWFENRQEGGCAFFVQLPSVRPTVMVVSEDQSTLKVLTQELETFQLEVSPLEPGKNGEKGKSEVMESPPDLLIFDIRADNNGASKILSQFQTDDRMGLIPLVVTAAKGEMTSREAMYNLGADAFLPRPYSMDELKACLRRFVL